MIIRHKKTKLINIFLVFISGFLALIPGIINAQVKTIGIPLINNYPKSIYHAGTQNWDITQAANGLIYFGNNDGLLEFDGENWNTYELPNPTIIRSVLASNDTIFVGAFNEFGYFAPDRFLKMKYTSLTPLLPHVNLKFEDIWKIHQTPDGIVFQSFQYVFAYKKNKITVLKPDTKFTYSFKVNQDLYIFDESKGFGILSTKGFLPVCKNEILSDDEIRCILPLENEILLIGTLTKGCFLLKDGLLNPWLSEVNAHLLGNALFSGLKLNNGLLAFGSIRDGLYITNQNGEIYQHLNRDKGLQNNTILSLYQDIHLNLWLGLDNGIDHSEIISPISALHHVYNLESVYSSIIYDQKIYAGTNQGLFVQELNKLTNNPGNPGFSLIKGTEGQVWCVKSFKNKVLCGHNLGLFQVEGKSAVKISDIKGFCGFDVYGLDGDTLIAGTYGGLVALIKKGNSWVVHGKLIGFDENSRNLLVDRDKKIWVSHGYRGLYRLTANSELTKIIKTEVFDQNQNLPESKPYNLNLIDHDILISTSGGFYAFNKMRHQFINQGNYNMIFRDQKNINKLVKDQSGNLWYFSNQKMGVYRRLEDGNFQNVEVPFYKIHDILMSSFENISFYKNNEVFIGTQKGLIHYSSEYSKDYKNPDPVYIQSCSFRSEDSVKYFFTRYKQLLNIKSSDSCFTKIPNDFNSFILNFSSPAFESFGNIKYSYRLVDFEKEWSAWGHTPFKEYTNMHEGTYTFEVRSMNAYGAVSAPASLTFCIKPPWHRSRIAFVLYAILSVGIIYLNILFQQKRVRHAKQRELDRFNREMALQTQTLREQTLLQDQEIIKLKNDTLEKEIQYKNRELANSTFNLLHKNKTLTTIKNQLGNLMAKAQNNDIKHEAGTIIRKINKEISSEGHQKVFNKYFDEVHNDFINRLKATHPELTSRELRLCAYLRMNLSTKEISPLMNISVRGVEISRYRLRKKLNLDHNINLTDYILNF